MKKNYKHIRIHGDNIIECERSLELISQAYKVHPIQTSRLLYKPSYTFEVDDDIFNIDLLPGYDRWGICITDILMDNGGILRECADSYITEIVGNDEHILFAIEYCSALPAGNNAWQRNGRAYSSVMAGIPYLYYAEIGGVELDENRNVKAPRFPNPVVPFSYIMMTNNHTSFSIAIYKPHPSITEDLYKNFKDIFGYDESLALIKAIIASEDYSVMMESLKQKEILMVKELVNRRRCEDTFKENQWDLLLKSDEPATLINQELSDLKWGKKISSKVNNSDTYQELFTRTMDLGCLTIGSKDLPICLVPNNKLQAFKAILEEIYPEDLEIDIDLDKSLAIVWITGFKPKGDDSRPDRGLTPLAKMILDKSATILVVVSGPAKKNTWDTFINSPENLAKNNGLWQSILNIADYVFVDSTTCDYFLFYKTDLNLMENDSIVMFKYIDNKPIFSEHDTDTAIHQIFSRKEHINLYESLCNPPGGDWSGISYFIDSSKMYRWTSLPRVSQIGGKRPDHVIQFIQDGISIFIVIESKQNGRHLEDNIGTNLIAYINDLFNTPPTAYKDKDCDWRLFEQEDFFLEPYETISVGAFIYKNEEELEIHLKRGKLDAVLAFEFGNITKLHILCKTENSILLNLLNEISKDFDCLEIQIHRFFYDVF